MTPTLTPAQMAAAHKINQLALSGHVHLASALCAMLKAECIQFRTSSLIDGEPVPLKDGDSWHGATTDHT